MKGVWKFVGGCFVGAASAIVVSPQSGSELRRSVALRLAHGLERAAGETPEGTSAPSGRRAPQEAPSRTAGAGVMPARPAGSVGSPPAPVAAGAVAAPVSSASDDTAVRPPGVTPGEPERLGPPPLEAPVAAAPASQEAVAPPSTSISDTVRPPIPEAPAVPAAEPAVKPVTGPALVPLSAESPASVVPVSEAEEVEMPAPESPPAEAATLDSYVPPAVTPDASTVEEAPVETVTPEPAEVPSDEAAMRPETAVLAAAAQSAAAIGTPAVGVDAAREESPEASGIDDLRARIEQTKAAVREALEKPFSADEPETWPPEGSGTAFAPDTGAVGDVGSTFLSHEDSAVASDDQTTGLEDVDVRSAFAEGSDEGVWMVPEAVAGEQAGIAPGPAMEEADADGAAVDSGALMGSVDAAPVAADEAEASSTATPLAPTPAEPVATPGGAAESAVVTEPAPQVSPEVRPESAAPFESLAEAGTAEASVWEPVATEEPVAPAAAVPDAAAQAATASELDQVVADAFTLPEEAPPSPEAAVVDQAEMRRRIEETRSRLKAKAFDAMTSGEAALLAHEPVETMAGTEADEPLDDEVQAVIDRSLSQDDY